jgi:cell division septation protein DedD
MSMPVKDEGEFEIVLGNRQILAVFAIVLLLMGLFFSLGFVAGRRSAGGAETAAGKAAEQVPITLEANRREAAEPGEEAPRKAAQARTPAPAETSPAPAAEAKAEPKKGTAAPERLYVEQPPAGMYLQAAATQRTDAEAMLSFITGKTGLKGYVTPSPKSPELCRVLIGPLAGNEQMAEARSKLSALGVTNAFPVKY